MRPFVFTRGETITLALDALAGDPDDATNVTGKLKPIAPGRTTVSPNAAPSGSFTVAARAAVGDTPAGWNFTLSSAQSAQLAPGLYAADARLEVGSDVIITDYQFIRIQQGASA